MLLRIQNLLDLYKHVSRLSQVDVLLFKTDYRSEVLSLMGCLCGGHTVFAIRPSNLRLPAHFETGSLDNTGVTVAIWQ